jgi:hypothetical protein
LLPEMAIMASSSLNIFCAIMAIAQTMRHL